MIQIIEGYAFEHDRFGYTLFETGIREKGVFGKAEQKSGEMVEYADTIGYFSSPKAMLEACMKHATRKQAENAKVKQIGDYLAIMRQISQEIADKADTTAF